jgi:hypothetical protein
VEFIKEGRRGSGPAGDSDTTTRGDSIARTKAYNIYVAPTLQPLAKTPPYRSEIARFFQSWPVRSTGQVKEPNFEEFRLTLQAFDEARPIVQAGRDATFGDPQYRITYDGLSSTPPG